MNEILSQRMKKEHYKFVSIDLFSGPGGLCTGFKWAGILPLIAVEWTDTTVETYSISHNADVFHLANYHTDTGYDDEYLNSFMHESSKSIVIHGDINDVSEDMIKGFLNIRYGINSVDETVDIVSGGAPCESFSMAGKRAVGDDRDDLFDNIIRISRAVNTKALLFENVKGLFSKPDLNGVKGAIFNHICDTIEDETAEPGYILASRSQAKILLKACDYGVPQLRERVFLVALRRDLTEKGFRFTYPVPTHGPGRDNPYITVFDAIDDLPIVGMNDEALKYNLDYNAKNEQQAKYINIMRGKRVSGINCVAPKHLGKLYSKTSLSSHKGPGHLKRKQALISIIPPDSSMKAVHEIILSEGRMEERIEGFEDFTYSDVFPRTIYGSRNRRLKMDQPSYTVTSHCLDELLHPVQNRAITPREAARLQSFPDWYQFSGPYVQFHGDRVQDRYEQIGDAIPPLLAFAIAKQLAKCIPISHKQ